MRTNFTAERLREPAIADAEKNLRACVHCGICTATCPTYVLLGDERDSPRGRIVMIQRMLEEGGAPSAEAVRHIDRCLSCLGCRTACPSSVDYQRLIDAGRAHIARYHTRPPAERLLRRFIAEVLTRPERVRHGFRLARLFAPIAKSLPGRLGAMATKGARALPKAEPLPVPDPSHKCVALMPGCVQAAMAPGIDAAAARALARRGVALVPLAGAGCCGALTHHLGETAQAKTWAKRAIAAFEAAGGTDAFEAVLITATGCGAHLKDYAHLFADEPEWSDRAAAFAAKVKDLSELLMPRSASPPRRLRIALQQPCSLQHGLRLADGGATALAAAGHDVVAIPEGHLCCGSAGSYSLLQPEIADELRARKLANAATCAPDAIVSSNIGCLDHLSGAGAPPLLHLAEAIDWSEGGPVPVGLARG
jgi:glycolate oxidase iron-sulfur subunit